MGKAEEWESSKITVSPPYLDHDAASHGEVAVEPGVPYAAAIALHAHLQATLLGPLGPRLHPQARAVRVRSNHGEAIAWQVASANCEGDDAGEVSGQEVLRREGGREEGLIQKDDGVTTAIVKRWR